MSKKLITSALAIITLMGVSGASIPVAHGQTAAELQAQISSLLATIAALQAQLGTVSGGGAVVTACSFTRDLTLGATGNDVLCLQQYLNGAGFQVSASGAGSPGMESTYFGAKTQAAVSKWQAANGVTPTAGYFGAKSRAKYTALAGMPGTPGTPGTPGVPVPMSGLSVSLASDNPTTGSLISSVSAAAARVPVLAVNLTAGTSGGVTVNELKFQKNGVLSDTAISSAYLIENGRVIGQFSSLSGGVITFTGLNLGVNAGQTRKVWLAIDPATGLSAGNTVSFSLISAMAVDFNNTAVAAAGMFPLNGATFTVTSVSNPSIAGLTVTSSSVGTSVYAGDQNVLVSQWTLTGATSPLDLKGLTFKVIGSANKSDLKNVKLMINGTQVGPTLAMVGADGVAHFDFGSTPARISTGSSNLQIYADVMGSPSFNFAFELLNSYDVLAIDTQYGVPVAVTIVGGAGTTITINQGSLTVSLASDTPTGNIAKGGSGVALAKFKIYAAGEPVKVKFLDFKLVFTGTTTTLSNMVRNIVLIDDAGNQVGTTINTPPSSASCEDDSTPGLDVLTYIDCFGTSSSNINYIVPANTTRVLTLRADVPSTAGFSTIVASLTGNNSNLQGQTSSQTASSGSVTGSVLTLSANSLTVSKNAGVGTQTYSAGANGVKIGSYSLSASSAEGVNLNSFTVLVGANGTSTQNLKLMVGSTQIGTTQPSVSANTSYTFSGNLNVPAGQSKTLDVYADILSGAPSGVTASTITTLSGCSGSGASTFTSVSCSSTAGQDIAFAGAASVTVAIDSATKAAGQIVMGSSGNELATFKFTETTNVEDVKITDLYLFQQVAATTTSKSAFTPSSLSFYNGATLVGTSNGSVTTYTSTSNPGPGYYYRFNFGTPVVVPRSGSVSLVLKGDVSSYSSSGATDNTTHVFKIVTATADTALDTAAEVVTALGNTSNIASSVTLSSATGNAQTVLRSKVTVAGEALGVTTGRSKSAIDDLGRISFTADAAGAVKIQSLVVTIGGSAPSGVDFFVTSGTPIKLYDEATGTSYNPTATSTTSVSFDLNNYSVSAGTTKKFVLRLNTEAPYTDAASNGVSQTLSASLNAATSVTFTTADSGGTAGVNLPANAVPFTINSVSYAAGT